MSARTAVNSARRGATWGRVSMKGATWGRFINRSRRGATWGFAA